MDGLRRRVAVAGIRATSGTSSWHSVALRLLGVRAHLSTMTFRDSWFVCIIVITVFFFVPIFFSIFFYFTRHETVITFCLLLFFSSSCIITLRLFTERYTSQTRHISSQSAPFGLSRRRRRRNHRTRSQLGAHETHQDQAMCSRPRSLHK